MNSLNLQFVAGPDNVGERLDVALTKFLQDHCDDEGLLPEADVVPTRSKVGRWIEDGHVQLRDAPLTKPSHKVRVDEVFELSLPRTEKLSLDADSDVPLSIVYEDSDLLVIDKAPGLVVHPSAGHQSGTLVHGLVHHLGESIRSVGDALRPGIVHRLDQNTSGLMLVAKNDFSHQALTKQFLPPRSVSRNYLALCVAVPKSGRREEAGSISAPIGMHAKDRKRMAVIEGGKEAVTHWSVKERFAQAVLLEIQLETGRTHQIRVHLQHELAAILGDPVYGPGERSVPAKLRGAIKTLGRQALHASELSFLSPRTGEQMVFRSELPEDIAELVRVFRESSS